MTMIAMPDRANENPPDPEVLAKPKKRTYSAEYKQRILERIDACTQPGEQATLLRREGLYSSTISNWRRERREGRIEPAKKGRPAKDPREVENEKLKRENARLAEQLRKANLIIDVQKKVSQLLGIMPETEEMRR